jgi:subfamily B ATP-binding cassette protein MsbA
VKSTSFGKLYLLLKPDVRPRIGALIAVLVLAAVTSFSIRAPILLLEPIWNRVLFPAPPSAAAPALEGAALTEEAADHGHIDRAISALRERVTGAVFQRLGLERATSGEAERMQVLWTVAGVLTVLAVLAAAAAYGFACLSRWVALRIVVDMRQRLARHLMGLSLRYHGQRAFGDLLSRISNDVATTLTVLQVVTRDLTQEPLMALGSLLVAGYAAPIPTLVMCLFLPVVAAPIALLGRRVRRRSRRSLDSLGASLEVLTEMFRGIRTVKAFRAEERELQRYGEMNDSYVAASMKMVRTRATVQAMTTMISHIGLAFLLILVGWLSVRNGLFKDGGAMMEFLLATGLLSTHLRRVARGIAWVQESAGAAERLHALLEERVELTERPGAVAIQSLGSGLRFEGVTLRYPQADRNALEDVSISLRPGETLALVGPSGAGKTTFVDLIARFIDPTSGRITVDGNDLRELTLDSWTRLYAMVGQVPFLFHTSILENIRYGSPDATREEIEEAARAAHVDEFARALPRGYDTIVGDDGAHLSGGQRQRITIARAILKNAPLLLLDEATSALDSESEAVVQDALESLMRNRTVIVIAHRLSTVRNADRIAALDQGRLVETGTHSELLARNGLYARLYAVQFDEPIRA